MWVPNLMTMMASLRHVETDLFMWTLSKRLSRRRLPPKPCQAVPPPRFPTLPILGAETPLSKATSCDDFLFG